MKPKRESANSPSARSATKKTPMIRLKRVKTLPATMLATERLEVCSTGPSWRSRFASSVCESPPGCRWSLTGAFLAKRLRGFVSPRTPIGDRGFLLEPEAPGFEGLLVQSRVLALALEVPVALEQMLRLLGAVDHLFGRHVLFLDHCSPELHPR